MYEIIVFSKRYHFTSSCPIQITSFLLLFCFLNTLADQKSQSKIILSISLALRRNHYQLCYFVNLGIFIYNSYFIRKSFAVLVCRVFLILGLTFVRFFFGNYVHNNADLLLFNWWSVIVIFIHLVNLEFLE